MTKAKLFQHGGSQAVRLPKAFRFEGAEVEIEKRGEEVVLRPARRPRFKTWGEIAQHMREHFPHGADFPDVEKIREQQERDLNLD